MEAKIDVQRERAASGLEIITVFYVQRVRGLWGFVFCPLSLLKVERVQGVRQQWLTRHFSKDIEIDFSHPQPGVGSNRDDIHEMCFRFSY